jgi:hypothetical protein
VLNHQAAAIISITSPDLERESLTPTLEIVMLRLHTYGVPEPIPLPRSPGTLQGANSKPGENPQSPTMGTLTPVVLACDPSTITISPDEPFTSCIILGTGDMRRKAEDITHSVSTLSEHVFIRIVSIANGS